MHLQKIEIKNFRLLANVEILLEQQTTVIVGRVLENIHHDCAAGTGLRQCRQVRL